MSNVSVLFNEEIYTKYININILTLKNLIDLQFSILHIYSYIFFESLLISSYEFIFKGIINLLENKKSKESNRFANNDIF